MRKTNNQDQYIRNLFGMDDAILQSIEVQLEKDHKEGIQISASDALILQFLIRSLKVKTIVEIGTLYGYSALCMARALPENGQLLTLDSESARPI
jgi:predicted O-methyltransferase YrrM